MIHSVTVINDTGDELVLELTRPEKSGLAVRSIKGLGPVNANINTSSGSGYDGATFNSARIDTRNIVLDLIFIRNHLTIEEIRLLTYKMFPIKKQVTLIFETDTRESAITGYIESNEPDIFSEMEGSQISIICPDPYFYSNDPDLTSINSVANMFSFPLKIEQTYDIEDDDAKLGKKVLALSLEEPAYTKTTLEFGRIKDSYYGDIVYEGDEECGVIIELHFLGSVTGLALYNTSAGQTLKLDSSKITSITGSGIQEADDIIINTNRGYKSVFLRRDGNVYNIFNALDKDFEWLTIIKGLNQFAFSATTGEENIRCYINNNVIYEGI